jgi:hypothetical protein
MNRTGTRTALAGLGLAAACAVICCSAPLLALVLPGLALLVGFATDTIEMGLLSALVAGALSVAVVLVWRRRQGNCTRGSACGCGCRPATPVQVLGK